MENEKRYKIKEIKQSLRETGEMMFNASIPAILLPGVTALIAYMGIGNIFWNGYPGFGTLLLGASAYMVYGEVRVIQALKELIQLYVEDRKKLKEMRTK